MKVRELIKMLKRYNPDARVVAEYRNDDDEVSLDYLNFVDWKYGDSNHSATLKCLNQNKKFLHLGPYYDNPNFETDNTTRTYYYNDKKFVTHLKGGFSENKLSYKKQKSNLTFTEDIEDYITLIND